MDDEYDFDNFNDVYRANVLGPLSEGEGVACFVVDDGEGQQVLYCTHRLTGEAYELAVSRDGYVRSMQAVAIQYEARARAAEHGYVAVYS